MIGFGFWAGVVGTYNAMLTWGRKHRSFTLKPAFQCADYDELKQEIKKAKLPNIKIALTGSGRVAQGANDLLTHMELHEVSVQEIVDASFDEPVFANFDNHHLFARKDGADWDRMHFYNNHGEYDGIFEPYLQHVDLLINGMYWEGSLPPLFSKEDTKINNFKPSVIADITCDVEGSVPITMRATSIQNPTLGWDRISQQEVAPFGRDTIEVMAVTNLPTELPHDASVDFSSVLSKEIIPQLLNNDELGVIDRASITKAGKLNRFYAYLQDYLDGEE
jgi:saccharopine dehydrogenase (NAD+, L-lysine-forming)